MNVGTGIDLTIRELAELIAEEIGFEGKIIWDTTKPDGTPKKQLNIDKLNALGWRPSIPLRQGIQETIKNFRAELKS